MRTTPPYLKAATTLLAGLACAATAQGSDGSLSACRGIAEDSARLACYDALADDAGRSASGNPAAAAAAPAAAGQPVTAPASPAAARPPAVPANASKAAATPEELFGRNAKQSQDIALRATGASQIDHMDARVSSVRPDANGKLVLALENGQVWSQLDSTRLLIKAGEEVRIRRALLDSYLLTPAKGGTAIRVRRSK